MLTLKLNKQPHSASSSAVLTLKVATGTLIGTGDLQAPYQIQC